MPSSPKARDLTGSLVRYGEKRPQAPRPILPRKQKQERDMTFDPFPFAVWCAVGCLLAMQLLLLALPELI